MQGSEPAGQQEPEIADGEIVVDGNRGAAEDFARDYLQAIEIGRLNAQAARWSDRICPKVMGIDGEIADRIVDRIRTVAQEAGIAVAPIGCKNNINIVFVDDGAQFASTLRRRAPRKLREVPRHKQAFVFESDAPVRWWYTTEVTGSGGRSLVKSEPPHIQCQGLCNGGYVLPSGPDTKFLSYYNSSRVSTPIERHIRTASVVIDVNRASGTAVDSLADYVALVTLSEIWPESGSALKGSILTLFEDISAPQRDTLTLGSIDRQFLCELYRLPLDRPAQHQKGRLLQALQIGGTQCSLAD